MSLTENKEIDRVEIVGAGTVQVRQVTTIMRDGQEIAKTFHRWSFEPGSNISEMPEHVQAIAKAAWTQDVIESFQRAKAEATNRMGAQA